MSFRQILILYGCTALVMLPLDIAWLGTMGRTFYKAQLGDLLLEKPAMLPALAFYLLYAAGVVFFAVIPAVRDQSLATALVNGAVLGLVAYGTYDLSNMATLKGFTAQVGLVDLAWGGVLTAATATGASVLGRWFGAA
ncbi:MAG: DUF2177 family protein [Alsobacter sp.]